MSLLACLVGLVIALGTLPGLAQAESPTLAELENPAAVTLGNQTLFTTQSQQITGSPEERTERISDRLTATANNQSIPVEALVPSDTEFDTEFWHRHLCRRQPDHGGGHRSYAAITVQQFSYV